MPQDPVADRLRTAPVADAIKASAWDAYESATDADDLAVKLRALPLPESVKADLWDLKASAVPEVAAAPVPVSEPERSWLDTAKDVGTGLAQSAVGSFVGAGELIHKIPGVSAAVDTVMGTPGLSEQAFTEARQATTPQNAPQSIGKFAGDIAQVLVPGSKITQAGQALARMAPRGLQTATRAGVEAVAGGTQAAIQGGDPTTGAVLGAIGPAVGATAGKVASKLKGAVPEHVMKALGPTKEKYKAMAERIAPGVVARRLGGSREQLQQQAADAAQDAGQKIDEALRTEHGGKVLITKPVYDALEAVKNRYRTIITRTVQESADKATPEVAEAATKTSLPKSFTYRDASPDELFADVLTDAKRQGFSGSPKELRALFDDAVKDARDFVAESADAQTPEGLLRAIARNGGLGRDKGLPGEIKHLRAAGSKMGDKYVLGAARTGSVGGVGRVLRSGGKSLDEMAEALRDDGFHFEGPNDLLAAIDDAVVSRSRPGAKKGLGDTLQMVGVRPGTKWWQAADEGFDVAALESAEQATEQAAAKAPQTVRQIIELDKRPIKQIQKLQDVITEHGDTMTVDQLVAVRRVWDDVVAQAGGYAHRAPGGIGMPLKDATEVWAKRKATTAIRQLLDTEVPELSVLNKEFAFWKSLDDVLTQTLKRTAPQGPGLKSIAAEGAGRLAGALSSSGGAIASVGKGWVLGKLVKLADAAFSSPRWQFASARVKDDLADAIVNGKVDKAAQALSRVLSVQGSKVMAGAGAQ